MNIFSNKSLLTVFSFFFLSFSVFSQSEKFQVVLDAGHGGKDPGNSYHGYVEKDIALRTTLKVGKILQADGGFSVIYTRTTDDFIKLDERPKIANKASANLFVSIHCNSVNNFEPNGTETFVMGMSRAGMNLEVAKNENAVIYLEDNYKQNYKGFDPKNPESLLGLSIMQEENLNNSISLATKIQDNFTYKLNRKTRGVKQQPLWVLDAVYMPGVLIELGFLSNKEEGAFLNSDEGQDKMANEIAMAIKNYRNEYFGLGNKPATVEIPVVKDSPKLNPMPSMVKTYSDKDIYKGIDFKVQLTVLSKKIDLVSQNFKGLNDITFVKSNGLYKYYYGETSNYEKAKDFKDFAQSKGYSSAFLVAFKNGRSVDIEKIVN
ncbi:MAG: N-acetylmuramoyl-L-alanine amidase [Flavobacterium sp.]|jgi:N-acetylmuramoyl-L-alanine amidase